MGKTHAVAKGARAATGIGCFLPMPTPSTLREASLNWCNERRMSVRSAFSFARAGDADMVGEIRHPIVYVKLASLFRLRKFPIRNRQLLPRTGSTFSCGGRFTKSVAGRAVKSAILEDVNWRGGSKRWGKVAIPAGRAVGSDAHVPQFS